MSYEFAPAVRTLGAPGARAIRGAYKRGRRVRRDMDRPRLGGYAQTVAAGRGLRGYDYVIGARTIGDISVDAGSPLLPWVRAVKARGNATSLMPSQSTMPGVLAERIAASKVPAGRSYPAPAILIGNYWYVPAPAINQQMYAAEGATNKTAIANDKFWDALQPGNLLSQTGSLARAGVSAITGIPTWAIPLLLIGAGAFVLMSAAHSILPDRR